MMPKSQRAFRALEFFDMGDELAGLHRADKVFLARLTSPGLNVRYRWPRMKGGLITAPLGAFYLYPSVADLIGRRISSGQILKNDVDVSHYLLDWANVAVMDGASYGCLAVSAPLICDIVARDRSRLRADPGRHARPCSKLRCM